ncbi:DNA polymerase Y family protein [Pedobacter sp. SYSU D00535]|uniref:Y-family DNA polymerase n=1 Tax=Pedobacter sp. SYSU D00535 TaxID=2810308 RepID=UPI001A96B9ED|nr:DNA polymerase Y family protein [Pedobacter sp. SYSU D00535]
MQKRFVSIWFRHLLTDWFSLRQPELAQLPLVFVRPERGRKIITAVNVSAAAEGISKGMVLADAKAMVPEIQVFDEKPGREAKLLEALGEWCIRYTPVVAVDLPDGLILDVSGCAHLWGGEKSYLKEIINRLGSKGYHVRVAIADTIGAAWAVARFGKVSPLVESGKQTEALLPLPPAALRLEQDVLQRLHKLGFYQISSFIGIPRSALRRRFGEHLLLRLNQALGQEAEYISPLQVVEPYQERLPCLEPIRTATGIEIAVQTLLETLCKRLHQEGKGLRTAVLKCYRVDGQIQQVAIGTNEPSHHIPHLFKLFQLKIADIEPALGIELFVMEAPKVEDVSVAQEALWASNTTVNELEVTELLDRLAARIGPDTIHKYLPDEHYWPERSLKTASSITAKPAIEWRSDRPRPMLLLARPGRIEVTAPVPDYPPMSFRYKGQLHYIKKADGPERIEREWWLEAGVHRDYYQVEDEEGRRYWLFRSGHYSSDAPAEWFIHGFFA